MWWSKMPLDDDGIILIHLHRVTKDEAIALANSLKNSVQSRLLSGGNINYIHWNEVDPVYGSDAYQSQGTELTRKKQERDEDLNYN